MAETIYFKCFDRQLLHVSSCASEYKPEIENRKSLNGRIQEDAGCDKPIHLSHLCEESSVSNFFLWRIVFDNCIDEWNNKK